MVNPPNSQNLNDDSGLPPVPPPSANSNPPINPPVNLSFNSQPPVNTNSITDSNPPVPPIYPPIKTNQLTANSNLPKTSNPLDEPLDEDQSPTPALTSANLAPPPASSPANSLKFDQPTPPSFANPKPPVDNSPLNDQGSTPPTPPNQTFSLPSEQEIFEEKQRFQTPTTPPPPKLPAPPPVPPINLNKNISDLQTPKPTPIKKPPRSIGKTLLIIFLILLVISGGLFSLDYFKVISIPYLSNLFNFAQNNKDFEKKINASMKAINDNSNYNFSATIMVKSNQATSETKPAALELPDLTNETNTDSNTANNNLNLTYKIEGERDSNQNIKGIINISPQDSNQTIYDLTFAFITDSGKIYLQPTNSNLVNQEKWSAIEKSEFESSSLNLFKRLINIGDVLPLLQSGVWQSSEEVVGESGEKIKTDRFLINAFDSTGLDVRNSSVSLNIADKLNYPTRLKGLGEIKTDDPESAQTISLEYSYYNFDQVNDIEIPDQNQLKKTTMAEFLKTYGFYQNTSTTDINTEITQRDETRKADLSKIAAALSKYQAENGTYPVSVEIDKTNNSTVLAAALISAYLDKLPVDPLDSQYWYGYNSDGYSFRLTSILENKSDDQAIQGSMVLYQEIKN